MANRFGLTRNISPRVRREIRKRCGFGCVVCGCALFEYHHFDPEYAFAKQHDPNRITLLCRGCHWKAGQKITSLDTVRIANRNPKCKQLGYAKDVLDLKHPSPYMRIGGVDVRCDTIVRFDDTSIVGFSPPEDPGGPLRLNAVLTDDAQKVVLRIVDNEWRVGSDQFDVEVTGRSLTIRDRPRKIVLQLSLAAEQGLWIERLDMAYCGFKIFADAPVATPNSPICGRVKIPQLSARDGWMVTRSPDGSQREPQLL